MYISNIDKVIKFSNDKVLTSYMADFGIEKFSYNLRYIYFGFCKVCLMVFYLLLRYFVIEHDESSEKDSLEPISQHFPSPKQSI